MSYLHPAYYPLLPASARPQLIAYLQLVDRNVHQSKDGWTSASQAQLAAELGRTARAVKMYERVCRDLGILEVEHGQARNRRRLRLRSARQVRSSGVKPASTPLREWGNTLPHSGETRFPTQANSHLLPRARSSSRTLLPTQTPTPKPAAPAEGGSAAPKIRHGTMVALARELEQLALGGRWTRKVAELLHELVRRSSEREAVGYLGIVRQRCEGTVDPARRAKGVLAMLEARLRKLRERAGPRTRQ